MSDLLGWAAIIVFLFTCLGSTLLFLPAKAPVRVKTVTQPKRRQLRRPSKDRQKRYYQRRIRVIQEQRQQEQQQWLLLIAALSYHHYRREQAIPNYN